MGIKDIMSMPLSEFNKLTESALRSLTGKLVSAANKRVRRFGDAGETSPALAQVEREGKFSTRNKTFNEVRAEFARARRFLTAETGDIRGARRVKNRVINALETRGVDISPSQYNRFFDAYEKLKELSPAVAERRFKYMVMREMSDRLEGDVSSESIARQITTDFNRIYEREEELQQEKNNVSDFFETTEIL